MLRIYNLSIMQEIGDLTHDTHNLGPVQCPYIAQLFDFNEK